MKPNAALLQSAFTVGLIMLAVVVVSQPTPTNPPVSFRVMTFNIHHGEGLDGKIDLPRIAELITSEGVDLVALQEVDKGVERTRRVDMPKELANLTGMSVVFSNNFSYQGGEYGNAILSRFPVLSATNLLYTMLRTNEQRGLLQVRLDVQGRELELLNTHIDYRGDDTERLMNVRQIKSVVNSLAGKPAIICGDFNDTSGSHTYKQLATTFRDAFETSGKGEGSTYPSSKPAKRIDYIWFTPDHGLKPVKINVASSIASDHLPVVAEFELR